MTSPRWSWARASSEKHFTPSRAEPGPDSGFSLEPDEFRARVEGVRAAEKAVGTIQYGLSSQEEASRNSRRSHFVVRDMKAGEEFNEHNVRSIHLGHALPPSSWENSWAGGPWRTSPGQRRSTGASSRSDALVDDRNALERVRYLISSFEYVTTNPGERACQIWAGEVLSSTDNSIGIPGHAFEPNLWVPVEAADVLKKQEAIQAYIGEIRPYPHPRSVDAVEHLARLRGCQGGVDFAEALRLL